MSAATAPLPRYSWSDYQRWPDEERWELIDGVAYNRSPAPTTKHQSVAGNLFARSQGLRL